MAEETTTKPQAEAPKPQQTQQRSSQQRPPQQRSSQQRRRHQGGGGGGRQYGGGRRPARRRVCSFCVDKVEYIDYKKPEQLSSYLTHHGKIYSRRRTGTCAKHQRWLAAAIKRARFLALLPHTADHIRLSGSGGGDSRR